MRSVSPAAPSSTPAGAVIYPERFRNDALLLAALQAREPGASAELYDRFAAHIQRVLVRIMGADPEIGVP